MTPRMKSQLTLSLLLSIGLTTCVTDVGASANQSNSAPVSKERQPKSFDEDGSERTPAVSRFHRRLDYREEEKVKAKEAEDAQKKRSEEHTSELQSRQYLV